MLRIMSFLRNKPSVVAIRLVYTTMLLAAPAGMAQQKAMTDDQIDAAVRQLETSFPHGSIDSMTMVGNVIDAAAKTKAHVQAWYLQSEHDCYDHFFVTACLNQLRVKHVQYNDTVQKILVEAKAFQRKQHIDELDEALRLKQSKSKSQDFIKK